MSQGDVYEYSTIEENLSGINCLIALVILIIITIIHTINHYSDFFTTERKVLDHRRKKPPITPGYKKMAYLTIASLYLFLFTVLGLAIQYDFTVGKCKSIVIVSVFERGSSYAAKCVLYLVLIYRLHEVYNTSAFGYSPKKLYCIGITTITISVFIALAVIIGTISIPVYIDDTDNKFPYFCQVIIEAPFLALVAAATVLFDVSACILSMIFFILPLRKVIKACEQYTHQPAAKKSAGQTKRFEKMLYAGSKYKILVIVAALSTFLWILLLAVGLTSLATIIGQLDYVINPLCLILMTPYYPSDKYFERLCCPCIFCCDPQRKLYQSKSSKNYNEKQVAGNNFNDMDSTVVKSSVAASSVDTDIAIKNKVLSLSVNDAQSNLAAVQEYDNNNKDVTPAPVNPTDS